MTDFQRPRGTRDFPPEEMEQRRIVEDGLRKVARSFNFGEVMTPTFENTELFVAKSGPGIIDEIYAFKDKGDREISLRPELTAAVMRYYVKELHTRPKPLKLYYMGNCFRYERPQKGRYREFWQFGAEIIGAPSLDADAEVLALAYYSVKNLGLNNTVMRIGHLGVLNKFIEELGVSESMKVEVRRMIDKRDFESLRTLPDGAGAKQDVTNRLIELVSLDGGSETLEKAKKLMDGDDISLKELKKLLNILEKYGITDYKLDFGVARGLDYYTGMVFEIDAPNLGAEKQICGGGAYSLSETFGGQPISSTGFAFGFDRLMLARSQDEEELSKLDVYFIPISDDARMKCLEMVTEIRNNGISADIDLLGRKVGKAFGYADTIGAKTAIVIGDKELAEEKVMVKDMATGDQTPINFSELLKHYQN